MRHRMLIAGLGGLLLLAVAACSGTVDDAPGPVLTPTPVPTSPSTQAPGSAPGPTSSGPEVVRTVATDLEVPWGLDFLPDGRAVVTERASGRVLLVRPGQVAEAGVIEQTVARGEGGLLGVAVSPDFDSDRMLYFYVTTATDNRVIRAPLRNGRLGEPEVVLAGIPKGVIHDGGRLLFGPEGMLFVSTGETGNASLAQDLDSLAGKILRITPDGEPAPGNPFPGSPVYSYGHRNVEGLAIDDEGRLWASEFGSSEFDELNLIKPGHNYGWPLAEGTEDNPDLTDPQAVWRPSEASPAGLAYTDGHLWMAALRGERLWRIDVSTGMARNIRAFFVDQFGRLRSVEVAPNGNLWVATSNRDGRGDPVPADDRIIAIRP